MANDINRRQAVTVIESLRAGVPTRASTRLLPDIRPSITHLIQMDLERFQRGETVPGRLLWGQFGQGKTHTLIQIGHIALDMGFAVSSVSLSRDISGSNLFQFYGNLAPNIRTPNSTVPGIQRHLDKKQACDLPDSPIQSRGRYLHSLPAIVLETYLMSGSPEEQNSLYGDLMGIRIPLPELRAIYQKSHGGARMPAFETPFRIGAHGGSYFGMTADALCFCGFKGWIILIDEVELMGRLGRKSRLQAYRNLNWLLGWTAEMKYPIYTLGACATGLQETVWYSVDGRREADRDAMPLLAEENYGSTAYREMRDFFATAINEDLCPWIRLARQEDLRSLLDRLVGLHGIAHHWDAQLDTQSIIIHIGDRPIRTHIRATLEALDQKLVSGIEIVPEAIELTEGNLQEDGTYFAPDHDEENETSESDSE